jgi:hypothetical protein
VQSDLEKQNDHAQLGQGVNHRVGGIEKTKHGAAQDHAGDQLSENRRLSGALHEGAEELGSRQQRRQDQQQMREGVRFGQVTKPMSY